MSWTAEAEALILDLLNEPASQPPPLREQGARLAALPLGFDLWSAWFVRPNGDVISVGEDEDRPEGVRVYSDRAHRLAALTWLSRRHPEAARLLPQRGPDANDCACSGLPAFAPGKVICQTCGGLGWLPAADGGCHW